VKAESVATVAKLAENTAAPLVAEATQLETAIARCATDHRARLTHGHRTKTATVPTGEVSFRMGRPRVIVDTSVKAKTSRSSGSSSSSG
jgi:phage host-nuclease inhibitor protein Gam